MSISDNGKKGFDIDFLDIPGITSPTPAVQKPSGETQPSKEADIKISEESREQVDTIVSSIIAKMKKKGDFPSFSKQISSVNKILHINYASAKDIADVIMKDFSLSQKLLQLVNSSFYGQFSNQGLTSITEAMIILGADCIQQSAASLMLFELMQASSQTDELKDVTLGSFMSGLIAKELAKRKGYRDTENFLICAMFHNLGQFLIIFYFPEKFNKINALIAEEHMDKHKAARSVMGLTYWELGVGVAERWGLPNDIIQSMKPVTGDIQKEPSKNDVLKCCSSFSNALCEIATQKGGLNSNRAISDLLARFEGIMDIQYEDLGKILLLVADKIQEHATQLNIDTKKSRLLNQIANADFNLRPVEKRLAPGKSNLKDHAILEKMKEISGLIKEGSYKIGDVLTMVLETMEKEFNYTRVAMCIRTIDANQIIVRYALGKQPEAFKKNFKFTIENSEDIFNAALNEGSDVIINDIKNKKYGKLIPKWYSSLDMSTGFAIYPIIVNKVPFGLFYADTDEVDLKQFMRQHDYMKKLRTLTVKAIKRISS
ncbi:MAG: HDOD domain-containing protein [Proteobacteria bacterium]|nr:HDOD domain-containing protein [Pseudomonadota bacterium]